MNDFATKPPPFGGANEKDGRVFGLHSSSVGRSVSEIYLDDLGFAHTTWEDVEPNCLLPARSTHHRSPQEVFETFQLTR
jgi:hypothetical protein